MTWKSQPNFRDHVREKLSAISYFTVFLSWYALKHFKTARKRWGILKWGLLYEMSRSITKMIYQPSFAKVHSQKKKCNFPTFSVVQFSLFYMYSNFWERTVNNFGIGFFACCHQQDRQNEMHYKDSSFYTLPKKKRNFPRCVSICIMTLQKE